jgi:nitrogen fixation protein
VAKRRALKGSEAAVPPRVVLIDANVFFAPRMRDLVMHLHADEVINVHWTSDIESEWTRNVIAKQGADADGIRACLEGMRDAVPGWEVTGYAKHIDKFDAVHAQDRHVAAAAYKLSLDDWPGQVVSLVTKNVKHFPAKAFVGTEVTRFPLGAYIDALHSAEPERVVRVVETCRKKLKNPPLDKEGYVAVLMKHGCAGLVTALASGWNVECPTLAKDGTLNYEAVESNRKPPAAPGARRARLAGGARGVDPG